MMLPLIPKISQLAPGIVRILGMNPSTYTLQGTNSYIIGVPTSKSNILIDTSSPDQPEYIDNLRQYFSLNQKEEPYISDIILTHWHADHIGSVRAVMDFARSQNWPLPVVHKLDSKSHPHCVDATVVPLKPDQIFDLSSCGMHTLKIVATPGHTDDHICLLLTPENILFSGDLILGHGSTVFENLSLYMDSLHKLESMGNTLTMILPAHGMEILSPMEKIEEYLKHRTDRIESVYQALSLVQWLWEKEILVKVYPSEILENQKLFFGAMSNQNQALEYLLHKGKVEARDPTESEKLSPAAEFSLSNKVWRLKSAESAKL